MKVWLFTLIAIFPVLTICAQIQSIDTTSFESKKGWLPFPVDRYARLYTYEDALKYSNSHLHGCGSYRSLTVYSDSIMQVKSPARGIVLSVFLVDDKQAVFVKHGSHFLAYNNLDTVFVMKGDTIHTGQGIGLVNRVNGDEYELDIMMLNNESHDIDPYPWFIVSKYF